MRRVLWLLLITLLGSPAADGITLHQHRSCRKHCPVDCPICQYSRFFGQWHLRLNCQRRHTEAVVQHLIERCSDLIHTNALILTSVALHAVPAELHRLVKVRHINMSNNALRNITPGAFDILQYLEELVLDTNHLEQLSGHLFNSASLKRVYARRNRIAFVASDAFSSAMHNLELLDLSENLLKTLEGWPLLLQPRDMTLVLNLNIIQMFNITPHWQWSSAFMKRINLRILLNGNNIQHMSNLLLGWHIDDRNFAEYIEHQPFRIISLTGNHLWCDCRDYQVRSVDL